MKCTNQTPIYYFSTSYAIMNDWMKLSGRTAAATAPVTYDRDQWKPQEQVSQPPQSPPPPL